MSRDAIAAFGDLILVYPAFVMIRDVLLCKRLIAVFVFPRAAKIILFRPCKRSFALTTTLIAAGIGKQIPRYVAA